MRFYLPSLALFLFACDSDKGITVFNPGPEAEISSHSDGDEVLEGMVITFEGNVTDANHQAQELTTTWKSGSDILCEATVANSDGTTVCEAVLTPEDTEITLEVKDAENSPGSDTITITVIPSANPVAEIITPEANGVYYSDQLITFEALLSDEEDDAELLVAFWKSNLDGDLIDVDSSPDSSGSILGYGYLTEGEHAIELNVEDTTGKTDRESVIINVGPPNSAPLCEITEPTDGSAGPEGDSIQFVATASDVDVPSDMLTVTWSSDKDGDIGSSVPNSSGGISFSYADLSVNTHNISMKVTDEVGETCTATINYTVGTPPSISIDAPVDGETYSAGEALSFSATVSDAQDQPYEIALDWSLNGTSVSTQGATSTGTAQFSDATLAYGAYNLIVTATDTDGLTDSDQINFTINGLPTQPVISIDPDPADTNDTLTVVMDTASTDPEGSTVNYTYEWLMGGAVQSTYTSSTVPSSATNKNEQWTVRVTPNDGIADGPVGEATITIANTAPILSALAITPTSNVYNDITLTCSVVVTDPDETLTPSYEWSIGSTVVGSGTTLDLSSAGAMPNDVVTCAVSVVDGDGETASDSTTTTVENRAPSVSGATISPSTGVTTGMALNCSATVSDDDGESPSVSYEWQVGSNTYTGDSLSLDNTMVSPGDSITCTVSAEDGYGGTASDSVSITVENSDPVLSDVSIAPDTNVTSTTLLTCGYTASDDDGDTPTPSYVWSNLSTGINYASTTSTVQLTPSDTSPNDSVQCAVTITDADGGSALLNDSVTISNTDPTFSISATITASGTQVGDTLTCFASGADQDDGTITPTYTWEDANGVTLGTGPTLALTASNSAPTEDITCVATITDSLGASATSSDSVTVDNTDPVFDVAASISPNTGVFTTSTLVCSGIASDADGDTPSMTYAWSNSNGSTYASTTSTLTLSQSNTSPGEDVTCTLTATDAQGVAITSSASVTVENTIPTITASISSNGTSNTGELTCSATASDVDDFPTTPTLSYEWFDSTGSSLGTDNPLQLDSSMGVDGDDISCVATATDLSGGTASDTAIHTITNTPPVIDSISLSPASPDVNTSALTCNVSGSDADGDTVTFSYEWLVDNQTQTETTNMFAGPFIVGSIIACRSTPNDGKIDGDVEEDTATVSNTAPVVDSVTLSPSTVYTNDTITATAVFSDDDTTQIVSGTYAWHVVDFATGVDTEVQSGSDNTLSGVSFFDRDDEVYVIVTPNDGVDDGVSMTSSSITVSNTAPTAPSVSITPDPATAGQDDLVCSVDTPSSDDDGGSLVYTYVWTDDSGTVQQTTTESAATTDTFFASGTSEGTWTCEVTPYDMTDYGSSDSSTVTVESDCSSLSFDGANDYVNTPGNVLGPLTDMSIATWLKVDSTMTYSSTYFNGGVVGEWNESVLNGWILYIRGTPSQNYLSFWFGSQEVHAPWNPNSDQWYKIAVVKSGTSVEIFVDDILIGSGSVSNSISVTYDLDIGSVSGSSSEYFAGEISNLSLWKSSLSSGELSSYWATGDSGQSAEAEYVFNSANTALVDDSGNGNDGTINGATWVNTCPEEDLDGDGVAAWEDCDDGDASISASESGGSENCPATSCKSILDDGHSTGNGNYWIDPDGSGAFEVYCDMTTDGGGWTLIAQGGDANCSAMNVNSSLTNGDHCSYLSHNIVSSLATVSTKVMLQVNESSGVFGAWTSTAVSINHLAVAALTSSSGNWHNGAVFDNWDWSGATPTAVDVDGWPNMYQSWGNSNGVHWYTSGSNGYAYLHTNISDPILLSATWIR